MKTRKSIQTTKHFDLTVKDRGKMILERIFQNMNDATQLNTSNILNSGGGIPELKVYIEMCIIIAKNLPFMVEAIEHGIVYNKKECNQKTLSIFEQD